MNGIFKRIIITISLAIVGVLFVKYNSSVSTIEVSSIVINEICNNNFSTAPLEERENVDWIELYNSSDEAINLLGWSVSDDEEDVDKYVLPNVEIGAGEYLLLYATGDDIVENDNIFLNYKLSTGEKIFLRDENGIIVDCVEVPDLSQNTSYARVIDAGNEWENIIPTPWLTNNDATLLQNKVVSTPVFSIQGGYYTGLQVLELSVDENLDIYYTLDGSEPTKESILYTEPILIENRSYQENVLSARSDLSTEYCYRYAPEVLVDKITVVRAVAVDSDGNTSEVVTNSYIVDIYQDSTYENLGIVSLSTNPDSLFDLEEGAYVLGLEYIIFSEEEGYIIEEGLPQPNYLQRGRTSEMPACIEVFDAEGNAILNQDVGIRIRGGTTRFLSQKSFSVYAREMYSGTECFNTDIFGNDYEYDKLILLSDRDVPKIRHELHSQLLKDRAVETPEYEKYNVFLDGEYWGVYALAEAYTEEYIQNRYDVPKEEVVLKQGLWPAELYTYPSDMDDEEKYEALVGQIDLGSFIDYYASMIYIDHWDWLGYNGYMWKSSTVSRNNPCQDGKWRWMLYDTELCEEEADRNTFQEGNVSSWQDDPFIDILMKSQDFREQFVVTFMDLANTVFEKEHVLSTIDSIFGTYSQTVEAQGIRWGDDWADEVYEDLDDIREFFTNRLDYIVEYLQEEFELQGELVSVKLMNSNPEKGTIKINTVIPELVNDSWQGYYFTDYPIELSVEEVEKESFVGWYDEHGILISDEKKITVELQETNCYIAVFG